MSIDLFEVEVALISNTAVAGIVRYNNRLYLIELGLLVHSKDNTYKTHISNLTREMIVHYDNVHSSKGRKGI